MCNVKAIDLSVPSGISDECSTAARERCVRWPFAFVRRVSNSRRCSSRSFSSDAIQMLCLFEPSLADEFRTKANLIPIKLGNASLERVKYALVSTVKRWTSRIQMIRILRQISQQLVPSGTWRSETKCSRNKRLQGRQRSRAHAKMYSIRIVHLLV